MKKKSWKEWLNQPIGAKKAAEATQPSQPEERERARKSQLVERPLAPPVGELDVWTPILFLVGMFFIGWFSGFFLGSLSWFVGLLCVIFAAIYVHDDAKKYGVKSHAWLTLLFALIGLPLHANELHKLRRAQQTGQVPTLVAADAPSVTAKPQPSVNGRQVADVVKPTKFCRECGASIPRDSIFCEECGGKLI